METAVSTTPDTRMTNEQAYDRALEILLGAAGLDRTQAILSEVIVDFRKREPDNAHVTDDPERAFAFGPDLLARARAIE
ncbi:hypothetical protein [Burkholderia sp. MSMB1589WGS]|uniref:hypothetical protein n=1 Tax=Burkholderia sp. MSMB1589WGS TaxID=1636425 RepID=UPI0007B7A289|nr:hypothetical protein [Burkholderia sp. MSMB1589WGS]